MNDNSEFPWIDEEEMSPEEEQFVEELVERAHEAYERQQALKAQQAGNSVSQHESDDAVESGKVIEEEEDKFQ